ncbi:GatB/GatE catalytic domain-containing protein [Blastocladiella britannica]|nr:GatB/GatE catalytic domain-containing protein [Blastocladiella britannica]
MLSTTAAASGPVTPVIGLEFHAQIASRTKLFSSCVADMTADYFGRPANVALAPVDIALPGTLPVLQPEPVVLALATSLALGCTVPSWSAFERKHYDYADLPAGYQITQRAHPLAVDGALSLPGTSTVLRIEQVQLEQDTGKSTHDGGHSTLDFNRAGVALMEIVTKPDLSSPPEAANAVKTMQTLLRTLATCDASLDEGSLRIDVNVSVADRANGTASERVEIKNIATVSGLVKALEFEIDRQSALLATGDPGRRETRGYDATTTRTFALRAKESAADYRYVADANIPSLTVDGTDVARVRAALPELPWQVAARAARDLPGLAADQLHWLTHVCPMNRAAEAPGSTRARYWTALCNNSGDDSLKAAAAIVANGADYMVAMQLQTDAERVAGYHWLANDVAGRVTKRHASSIPVGTDGWGVAPPQLASLVWAVHRGSISGKAGKAVLDIMMDEAAAAGKTPMVRSADAIAAERGWAVVTDTVAVRAWAAAAMAAAGPRKAGIADDKYASWLVGRVVAQSRGVADPKVARDVVANLLSQK